MNRKVLVVAAHPDDEVLGCGATMAKHVQDGDEVHVLIMAEGVTSRGGTRTEGMDSEALVALSDSARKACGTLGAASLTMLGFPDNRMDSLDRLDIIKEVEKVIETVRPEILYTHHGADVNIDHRIVHDAVVVASRPVPGQPVKTLLFFEISSSTEWQVSSHAFSPNWFVDVSDTMHLKLLALEDYHAEIRPWPHARSLKAIEHLARLRGATIGREAAEAFILGRTIL